MATKIGINGFGRIGRCVLRALYERNVKDLEIVGINDLTDTRTLAHLTKYDSIHRGFKAATVSSTDKSLVVGGKEIQITAIKDPKELPWKAQGVDIVLECTVFIRPCTIPKLSSNTFAIGARQFVVQEPFETMLCFAGSYCSWFTPITSVMSWFFAGALMMTFLAPAVT